jgi:hypothetical protein
MQQLYLNAIIHRPLLMAARQAAGNLGGTAPYNYYFYNHIGTLLYCFEFVIDRIRDNVIRADPIRGHLLVRLEAISATRPPPPNSVNSWTLLLSWGSKLPVDDITDWTMIQREDALIREGGSDVIRLMEGH